MKVEVLDGGGATFTSMVGNSQTMVSLLNSSGESSYIERCREVSAYLFPPFGGSIRAAKLACLPTRWCIDSGTT